MAHHRLPAARAGDIERAIIDLDGMPDSIQRSATLRDLMAAGGVANSSST